jgi:NAD(P)-dependent dehydrogenase (short-subunit alcohol dehydrogenase family)
MLLTGATSGIGLAAARELARRGATLLIVARDRSRGEAVLAELKTLAHGAPPRLFLADLSSQTSVRELALQIQESASHLHVLIHNAGVLCLKRQLTAEGLEMTFAVNHLAPFLLTRLLSDPLSAGAPARVVTVASEAHRIGRIEFDDLQGEHRYRGFHTYAQSKLANLLFTYELSRRFSGRGVTANCLHPGMVNTGLWRESRGLLRLTMKAIAPFCLSPEEGSKGILLLAASEELEKVSGKYFKRTREAPSSSASYDESMARHLWEASSSLTKLSSA